jgi:hypothetical protein
MVTIRPRRQCVRSAVVHGNEMETTRVQSGENARSVEPAENGLISLIRRLDETR